jgi:hypothetical protein
MLEKYIKKINTIATELKNEYTCLTINNGFGYCGYGSELLRQRLVQEKIQCKVIIGRIFKNNEDTEKIKKYLIQEILSFDTTGPDGLIYKEIKDSFIKRGYRLPKVTGHGVVLIDDFIYDITSKQFDLQEKYSLDFFRHIWTNVYEAEITIDEKEVFKISNNLKEKKLNNTPNNPLYLNWH